MGRGGGGRGREGEREGCNSTISRKYREQQRMHCKEQNIH